MCVCFSLSVSVCFINRRNYMRKKCSAAVMSVNDCLPLTLPLQLEQFETEAH